MARQVPHEAVRAGEREHEREEHHGVVRDVRDCRRLPSRTAPPARRRRGSPPTTPACPGADRRCWRRTGRAGSTTSVRATHATFQMLNWPSPESMRPAEPPRTTSGHVMTTVMRRAAATTRTASPARERMGPYGSMTTHAARPTDAVRRAGRGVRGRGRVVLAGHRRAQRRRAPGGSGGVAAAALVARRARRRFAWRSPGSFRLSSDRAKPLLFSAVVLLPWLPVPLPAAVLIWAGTARVARLGGDCGRLSLRGRSAGSQVRSGSAPASRVPHARRGWRSSAPPSSTPPRRGGWRRSCRAAMSRTTSSSPRACGATATCASRTTISEATTASTSAATLRPDYLKRGADGQIYSIHLPGVPAVIAPVLALGGYGLVKFVPGTRCRRRPRPPHGARPTS